MPKVLCIYHENCTDGFGAAWAVRHALRRDNVEFHMPPAMTIRPRRSRTETLSSDFSYSGSCSMKSRASRGQSSCSIIRRRTAAEELRGLPVLRPPIRRYAIRPRFLIRSACALFDMERSGTGLALTLEPRSIRCTANLRS